jgi:membrane carboxypeptidase/penicillin-binding protein
MNAHHDAWINIHTYIISSLVCVALAVNVIFLMSLKSDKSKINNNEKIQVYRPRTITNILLIRGHVL